MQTNYMMPGSLVQDSCHPKSLGLVVAAKPGERKVKWIKDGYGRNFSDHYPYSVQTRWHYTDCLLHVRER